MLRIPEFNIIESAYFTFSFTLLHFFLVVYFVLIKSFAIQKMIFIHSFEITAKSAENEILVTYKLINKCFFSVTYKRQNY